MQVLKIDCDKRVRAYLELNAGSPVDLNHLPDMKDLLRNCLYKSDLSPRDKVSQKHNDIARIKIPDQFLTYDIIPPPIMYIPEFNKAIEQKLRYFTRQYILINCSLGYSITSCIRDFQDRFGFYEQVWSFDSIKKDFNRHRFKTDMAFMKEIQKENNRILLKNMSDLGMISQRMLKQRMYHERN